MRGKPSLIDMRRSDLIDALRHEGELVQWTYKDMAAELDRRSNKLMTRALVFATIANSLLTGILAIVAIVNIVHA